ncbi:hypothetical protein [Dactylosporangium darangshiense]|uniref:hypothetical protein n=1 Tax=Dactylosporangium darangshiense TaxID=579108 RepID=UPI0031EE9468
MHEKDAEPRVLRREMSVGNTATLTMCEETVLLVSSPLYARRQRRDTRAGTRAVSCFKQAIMVIRRFLDTTRIKQLASDNTIGRFTAYEYLHEGFAVLAAQAPNLEATLVAAKTAGYDHVNIDRTELRDRPRQRWGIT